MMGLDLDVLRSFTAIADHGGYAQAADAVNKTQSTVSMQMKRLEEQLDTTLFKKEGRRNVLTNDGRRLLEYARRLVALNDEAVMLFRQPDLHGAITIGTPDDYAEHLLPSVLAEFAKTHPRIEVTLVCEPSISLPRLIESGDIDLAIVTCEYAGVRGEAVRMEPLEWVTSVRHCPFLEDVIPLALPQPGCTWRELALKGLDNAGIPYRIAYTSANGGAVSAAVLSGLAISAMPRSTMSAGMRVLTKDDGFPKLGSFEIDLIRSKKRSSPVIDVLAEHVKNTLGNLDGDDRLYSRAGALDAA